MDTVTLIENRAPMPSPQPSPAIWTIYLPVMSIADIALKLPYYDSKIRSDNFKDFKSSNPELFERSCHTLSAKENIQTILKHSENIFSRFLPYWSENLTADYQDLEFLSRFTPSLPWSPLSSFIDLGTSLGLINQYGHLDACLNSFGLMPIARYYNAKWVTTQAQFIDIDPSAFSIYSNEEKISRQIEQANDLLVTGKIKETIARRYTNTDLKYADAVIAVTEPIPQSTGRTAMYACRVIVSWCKIFKEYLTGTYIDFLKSLFQKESNSWLIENEHLMSAILPVFEGNSKFRTDNFGLKLFKAVAELLFDNQSGDDDLKWISTEHLYYRLLQSPDNVYLSSIYDSFTYGKLDGVGERFSWKQVVATIYPMCLRAVCLMLSVLGLAEVAINPITKATISDVAYVRPTRLLAYATGRIKQYSPLKTENVKSVLQLSTDSLTIVSTTPNGLKLVEKLIDTHLTKTRATVSYTSLIKLKLRGELDQEVIGLKKLSKSPVLPPIWEDMLNKVRNAEFTRLNSVFTRRVFIIQSHYDQIKSIIKNDKRLCKNAIFGERNTVLFPSNIITDIISIIESYGITIKRRYFF